MSKGVKRLYNNFIPKNYNLTINPDQQKLSFKGNVTIAGSLVNKPSKKIVFHQKGLIITSAKITAHTKKGDTEINIVRINNHNLYDEVRLHADNTLYPGRYTIYLEFKGKITRPMHGIYQSSFISNGKDKKILATQLESHHAREMFPCIDEPEAKATFDLTLHSLIGEIAISNMPAKSFKQINGDMVSVFETTPNMSTYLLAFVTGDLDFIESKTKNGVVVRAYSVPEKTKLCAYALETTVNLLEFYNDYFGINYPLPKCDLVALPDFAAGAMENWGLITFREQGLLLDSLNTSIHGKQYIAMVIGHELAHQWFGNLVTMKWWTDLWLNEGFASWIEYLAVDFLHPEWNIWSQFATNEKMAALKSDALEHTHPVIVPVDDPNDIRTIFDIISYSKGASIINMLHEYLGKKDFQNGLNLYLTKNEYSNTETADLWDALEEVSKKPVSEFISAWINENGYPIINANIGKDTIKLNQQRFFSNPKQTKSTKHNLWQIPLLSNVTDAPTIMKSKTLNITLKNNVPALLNCNSTGFYRVVYNPEHLKKLGALIKAKKLSSVERMGLIADSFEASKAGYYETVDALILLENYDGEIDYTVWEIIATNLSSIRQVMDNEELRELMKPFTSKLIAKELKRLGWEINPKDTHFDRMLRPTIIALAAISDEPAVIKKSLKLFAEIKIEKSDPDKKKEINSINPDIRAIIYSTVARKGSMIDFEKLLKMHNTTNSSEERLNLTAALTSFEQPEIIEKALSQIISDNVRLQDAMYWMAYSFMNRHAKKQTWEWMTKNWDWLETNLGTDSSFYRIPMYCARAYSDEKFLNTFKSFFNKIDNPSLGRAIKQGIETIQWQSAWKRRDLTQIKKYFSN